jgi:hypothetical protein
VHDQPEQVGLEDIEERDRERDGRAVPAEVVGVFGEEQLPELIVRPELEVVRLIIW